MKKIWVLAVGLAGVLVLAIVAGGVLMIGLPLLAAGTLNSEQNAQTTSIDCDDGTSKITYTFSKTPDAPAKGLTARQQSLVGAIVAAATTTRMGTQAAVIAVMTAAQESDLGANPAIKIPNADGDAGPFQQRTLPGWYGTLAQVNNDGYAATAFLKGVDVTTRAQGAAGPPGYHIPGLADVPGWKTMSASAAAQAVQKSAYPTAYARHESMARAAVAAAGGATGSEGGGCTTAGTANASGDIKAYTDFMTSKGFTPGDTSMVEDPWGFYYGECTGYAVWAVRNHTRQKDFQNYWKGAHFSNANHWAIAARQVGIPVSATPKAGDIAQTTKYSSGHVAYVSKVNPNGTFDIIEANWGPCATTPCHTMGSRTGLKPGVDFENFIDFGASS